MFCIGFGLILRQIKEILLENQHSEKVFEGEIASLSPHTSSKIASREPDMASVDLIGLVWEDHKARVGKNSKRR